jgi:hypothetical protein
MKKERLMKLAGIPEDVRQKYLTEARYSGTTIPIVVAWASRYNGVHARPDWSKNPDVTWNEDNLDRALDAISDTLPEITADWHPYNDPDEFQEKELLDAAEEILDQYGFADVHLEFEEDSSSS